MKKYFTETQTNVATFIGGPVAGGLLIYRDFLKLGRKSEAQITLAVTFLLTVSLAVLIFNIPESIIDKIPNSIFASLYTVISAIVFSHFLKKEIKQKFDEGAKKSSNWLVTAYTVAGLLINVIILFAVGFNQPPFEGDKLEFGTNEVYYDKGNVSLEEIQKTATTLRYYGYFTNETQNAVRMEQNNNVFTINIPVSDDLWEDKEVIELIGGLRMSLEISLKGKVKVVAEDYKLNGETVYKTF